MIAGLRSGASLAATETLIAQRGLALTSKVEEGPGGRRDVTRVQAEVASFELYRNHGTLILGFYNDQLVRVEFRPADLGSVPLCLSVEHGSRPASRTRDAW